MGLRTASVRRPDAEEVMAPALTDTTAQPQNFNLPPKSPINTDDLSTDFNLDPLSVYSKKLPNLDGYLTKQGTASDNISIQNNMNLSPSSMGDEDSGKMGLQKTGYLGNVNKVKSNNDVDQLFGNNLEANVEDIMQQVMKHIDAGNNSSSDLNEVLDLNIDKDLLEHVDMMMDDQQDDLETAQKIKENQGKVIMSDLQKREARIERRLDFIRRRACKLQSRYTGLHISGEVAGVFEQVHRSLKKMKESEPFSAREELKPMSPNATKSLIRKLEMATTLQSNTGSRQKNIPKYFGSGSIETSMFRSGSSNAVSVPSWSPSNKQELQKVSEQLHTQLRLIQHAVDSEATESSSGGESCDEMQIYNNPHQQYLSIQKRALWKYSTERAAIASRWTWLQSQISDLEYRIRQHTELHKQIRVSKGPVQLGECPSPPTPPFDESDVTGTTVNGYRGQLPGASTSPIGKRPDDDSEWQQCARTRPLINFKKRKLLQVSGLHAVSKKAARPSTIRCSCVPPSCCALCTSRADPTYPRDSPDTLSKAEKVSLLDPGFHPVLSLPEDSSQSVHLEAIMKMSEWQQRSVRMKTVKAIGKDSKSYEHRTKKSEHRKKYGSLKQSTVSALSEKIKNKIRGRKVGRPSGKLKKRHSTDLGEDLEVEATVGGSHTPSLAGRAGSFDSPGGSPLLQMQSISGYRHHRNSRVDSYDIDNIVIPYSVAASTRVEKLQYKEILTPKWRISDLTKNNGTVPDLVDDSDAEDMSEEAVVSRHDRCELEERRKFLSYLKLPFGVSRQRSHKRHDSLAESSGGNTPDPMSPHPPQVVDGVVAAAATDGAPSQCYSTTTDESSLPSVALMRRRTISQSKIKDVREELGPPTDFVEKPPYDCRTFPLPDDDYDRMVKESPDAVPDNGGAPRAQNCMDYRGAAFEGGGGGVKTGDSGDSETTESAIGDDVDEEYVEEDEDEEDPNDPEWVDVEKASREKHHRR